MVLIYLTSEECIELEHASDVATTNSEIICLDSRGVEVARFYLWDVQAYTSNPAQIEALRDETCEEADDGDAQVAGSQTGGGA